MTKLIGLLILLLPLAAVADPAAPQPEKLKIGELLTLSGSFASAGEDCRKGINAAVTDDPAALELVYADSKNDPSAAITEFRKLVSVDNVLAIYTHRSSMGMALNPVSLTAGIPLLGAVGHKDFAAGNKYAFQIWPKSDDDGNFLAQEFIKRGHKKVALVFTEDEWTTAVSQAFRLKYTELGGTIVFDQPVLPAETDFRTLVLQIKSKSPDAIFMNMLLPQIAPLIKQAREFKVSGKLYSNFYVAKKEVLEAAGAVALEGVSYVEMATDLPTLKTKLGLDPNENITGLTLASFVATRLLAQAAAEIKDQPQTAAKLYEALLIQTEVRTPDHTYPVRNRCVEFPLAIKTLNAKGPSPRLGI